MTELGAAHELFVIIKDGKPVMVVSKDRDRPRITDITKELAELFHDALAKAGAA